jgi:hypothetical protein
LDFLRLTNLIEIDAALFVMAGRDQAISIPEALPS